MSLENRVTPFGEVIAVPARGLVYGNRGCIHDDLGRIKRAFAVRRWIACRLEFRGWQRGRLMQPGKFTELFFLDEATAFAAGHRPCALCRREDYNSFIEAWSKLHQGEVRADAIDERLHAERIHPGTRRQLHHTESIEDLPDGAFVARGDGAWLVIGKELLRWTPSRYSDRERRPGRGRIEVITPPSIVEILRTPRNPVVPFLHTSALA